MAPSDQLSFDHDTLPPETTTRYKLRKKLTPRYRCGTCGKSDNMWKTCKNISKISIQFLTQILLYMVITGAQGASNNEVCNTKMNDYSCHDPLPVLVATGASQKEEDAAEDTASIIEIY